MQLVKFVVFFALLLSLLLCILFLFLLVSIFLALLSIFVLFALVRLRFAYAVLLFFVAIVLLGLVLTISILLTSVSLQDRVSILSLTEHKDEHLRLCWFFIGNGHYFNAERCESIPIKEPSIFLLAVGDGDHLAVWFEDPIALLHASQHGR
jgi:energy-coupling factor transporter transmembrane protein EcfT